MFIARPATFAGQPVPELWEVHNANGDRVTVYRGPDAQRLAETDADNRNYVAEKGQTDAR